MELRIAIRFFLLAGTLPHFAASVGHGYVPETDVNDILQLAYDIRDMRSTNSMSEKKDIYLNGRNAKPITLQSLSLNAESQYGQQPYYNLYRNAYAWVGKNVEADVDGKFDGAPVEIYGDTLVQDLFKLNLPYLEADGVLATNVMMAVWGSLFTMLEGCKEKDTSKMNKGLDYAAAYWVGAGQRETDNDEGYSLYHMAEEAGSDFVQDTGESSVNQRVIALLNTMQQKIKSNVCLNDPTAYKQLRTDVRSFIAATNVVLVQKLLFYVQEIANFESDHVELFSLAVLPQVAACNNDIYSQLFQLTVSQDVTIQNRANTINAIQRSYYCLGVTCKDVGGYLGDTIPVCSDDELKSNQLSTYTVENDVRLESQIDLDLKHMEISFTYDALDVARDYYEYGWHSSLTLQSLASQQYLEQPTPTSSLFENYFKDRSFADALIEEAFSNDGPFTSLSTSQRGAAVMGLIQGPALYLAVSNDIETAIAKCNAGDQVLARKFLDRAVAFFIGSAEGTSEGGQEGGEMIFALAKRYCDPFGECEPTGAALDGVILVSLREAAKFISQGKCQNANSIYENNIKGPLITPAIQGTLYSGHSVASDPTSSSVGSLFGLSRTLLPVFNVKDSDVALSLSADTAPDGSAITVEGVDRLFTGVAEAVSNIPNLDCRTVGKLKTAYGFLDVCSATPTQTTYVPVTDVSNIARLSLDINEMRGQTPKTTRENVYKNGKFAQPLTLSKLSLEPPSSWDSYPMFIIYKNAFDMIGTNYFGDKDGEFESKPIAHYADSLVMNLFQLNREDLEAQSVVVLQVLMACWSALNDVLVACKQGGMQTTAEMNRGLDTAAAYYFGTRILPDSKESGYSLYDLAEDMHTEFVASSSVNDIILDGFLRIQGEISEGVCASEESDYVVLRQSIHALMRLLNLPVLQTLLYHVKRANSEASKDYVELFSLALLPQLSVCSPALSNDLFELTVASKVTGETQQRVQRLLEQSMSCFGISCADLGAPAGSQPCNDSFSGNYTSIAGYNPTVDVRASTYIDRDAKLIRIFSKFDQQEAAKDLFEFGWSTFFSLKDISSPQYWDVHVKSFERYNNFYASAPEGALAEFVEKIISRESPFSVVPLKDMDSLLDALLSDIIFYLSAVSEFESAIEKCINGDDLNSIVRHWDTGVALYVGSAEGFEKGGAEFGNSLYATARRLCDSFDRCEMNGNAIVNAALFSDFEAGSQELLTKHCSRAQEIFQGSIKPHMTIPLVQEVLLHASLFSFSGKGISDQYQLYLASRPIIALLNTFDPTIAQALGSQTSPSSTLDQGLDHLYQKVSDSLTFLGVACDSIGVLSLENLQTSIEFDLCDPSSYGSSPRPTTGSSVPPVSAPSTGTSMPSYVAPDHPDGLAWGRYVFTDPAIAESDALFSLAIKAMYSTSSISEAENVYTSINSESLSGHSSIQSIAQFSSEAWKYMSQELTYNFFRSAFYDDSSFDSDPASVEGWSYGDALVKLALNPENGNSPQLAAETALVMNTWMMIVHRMNEAVERCRSSPEEAVLSIDSAVALWIGKEQGEGRFSSGYMMYSIAQKAYRLYGKSEGESPVNSDLMDVFNAAQDAAGSCSDPDSSSIELLRSLSDEVVRLLSVPLLQNLLFYIADADSNMVQLYTLGFAPQAYGCNSIDYEYLGDTLVDGFSSDTINDERLKGDLAGLMKCLRLTCDDLGDTSTSTNLRLKELVNSVCSDLTSKYDSSLLAGYTTSSDVSELSRIDLDIHQTRILMKAKAYDAAIDIYLFGRNSRREDGFNTLSDLATSSDRVKAGKLFQEYKDYYGSGEYSDAFILSLFDQEPESTYASASRSQIAEAIFRTLQSQIIYMQVITRLRQSVDACRSKSGNPKEHVDEAVALFVGSMEGSKSGGHENGGGALLMALGKEMCQYFKTCESHGDATINAFVMFAFSDVSQWLQKGDCDSAEAIIDESIEPVLMVPIIQGLIFEADAYSKATDSSSAALASGAVFADSLLPIVKSASPEAASTIEQSMKFDLTRNPSPGIAAAVSHALATAVRGMGIECGSIGSLQNSGLSICGNNSIGPDPDTVTNLGEDMYVSTTYVKDRAGIALDIKQIEDALKANRIDLAQEIYEVGLNSPIYDSSGAEIGFRSIALFSTDAASKMEVNPLFHIAVHALANEKDEFMGRRATEYADSIVREAFEIGGKTSLAAEAAVALNVWMELANELFQTIERCKAEQIVDDDGIHSIDEAAAYWIGDGQIAGDPDAGHLLYALAEQMGSRFNMIDDSGQSRTNINILRLFHQAKIEMSYPDACKTSSDTVYRVSQTVNKLTSLMTAVLMQALIHFLHENDAPRILVYSHAFVPLAASCNPKTFEYLKSRLIEGSYQQTEVSMIISNIRSLLPCFGLQCDDIGIHVTESAEDCTDSGPLRPLAGYRPSQSVQDVAMIDLDILELEILTRRNATEAAKNLYSFGKHSVVDNTAISLRSLARSPMRELVPELSAYKQYYENEYYADALMMQALTRGGLSVEERKATVSGIARFIILPMAAKAALYHAKQECEKTDAGFYWDMAVAYLTGSLEGKENGGSDTGRLVWALGKTHCIDFGTCSTEVENSANINDDMQSLFYAGRGAISSQACNILDKTVKDLIPLMSVAIFQAIFKKTVDLVVLRRGNQRNIAWSETEVFVASVLPVIESVKPEAAEIMEINYGDKNNPIPYGIERTARAVSQGLKALSVDCKDIGESSDISPCQGIVSKSSNTVGIVAGVLIGFLAVIAIGCLLRSKRREDPVFVESKGVLNHTTDLVLKENDKSQFALDETDLLHNNSYDSSDDEHIV